jgi:hypothetical protein
VYALLSPFLNGVVRTSDAASAAQLDATAQTTGSAVVQAAIAAQGDATAAATALPPFANPALTAIGQRIVLGQALSTTTGITPDALISSSALNSTANTYALNSIANLNSLDTFNSIDSLNSLSSPNSLTAFNSIDSLTNATVIGNSTTATTPALASPTAPAPDQLSATNSVMTGDSGLLIQSFGAVALATAVQANPSIFSSARTPVIPPPAVVTAVPRINAIT